MENVIQLYEIVCKFPWSESCRAGEELVEVKLSITRSNTCDEADALERRVSYKAIAVLRQPSSGVQPTPLGVYEIPIRML